VVPKKKLGPEGSQSETSENSDEASQIMTESEKLHQAFKNVHSQSANVTYTTNANPISA
jgi:hypothetical protein